MMARKPQRLALALGAVMAVFSGVMLAYGIGRSDLQLILGALLVGALAVSLQRKISASFNH